jgi:XTP/dITP diphosphohydrolase
MKTLVVATGNPGKLQEMQRYLAGQGWDLVLKPDSLDVEETGATFAENARLKASEIAAATGQWAIADDSGLAINALGGAPGVYSARYGKDDGDRIGRVLGELAGVSDRSAQFVCAIALARPDGSIALESEGICPGEIAKAPSGSSGFGYDPIFFVPGENCTYAEMAPERKKAISHRGQAIAALVPKLRGLA